MGLSRVFGLCFAFLFASSVSAAVTIDLGPSDYRNWGTGVNSHTTGGLRSSTGQVVRIPPSNGNLTVTRNAVIPYGSLANGMRNFLRINPSSLAASAAVTGLFLAVDWVFDEAAGEWRKWGSEELTDPDLLLWKGQFSFDSPWVYAPTPTDLCEALAAQRGYSLSRLVLQNNAQTLVCYRSLPGGGDTSFAVGQLNASCPDGYSFLPSEGVCVSEPRLIDLDSSDWSELAGYLPSADPDQVASAGRDTQRMIGNPLPGYQDQTITGPSSVSGPETITTTTTETGDNIVTTTQTTTHITYGDTTITTTETTVTNTYTNGIHTGTTTTTETPGDLPVSEPSVSAEWPGFCDWASIVCDWIGWTQEEPDAEPDLPEVMDDDFYQQKSIQFGSKTCPPDYEINIAFLDTTVGVSMQPLCDFAGIIYYMVMAAAYIIAAYISIGVVRNG